MKRFLRIPEQCNILIIMLAATTFAMPLHAQRNHSSQVMKNLDIFHAMYRSLDALYVDTLDADKLVKVGIDAILHSLDPYTEYFPEEEEQDLKMLTEAKYGGIGSIIRMMKDSTIIISEPYEGMPAAEAGLQVGDVLLKIDDNDLRGKQTSDVSNMLRGEPGTTFALKYRRPGEQKAREVKITRKTIKLPAVPYYGMIGQMGYINLSQFTTDCYTYVRKAIVSLKQSGAQGIVFDLRGNGGGSLDQAVRIVNLFVPKDLTIVETRGKVKSGNAVYKTKDTPLDDKIPLAVLVNNGSASASEIVAGSLQDLDRAVVIGSRTYGKGLVQSIRELPYNGSIKLTTAKYYIPSGRCIQEVDYRLKRAASDAQASKQSTEASKQDTEGSKQSAQQSAADSIFHTANGREVLSGKGIKPDVEVTHDTLQNIVYYLSNDDVLINFGTKYCQTHSAPASVADFRLTDDDFAAFKQMVIDSGFSYDRLSEKRLADLKKVAQFEGYYDDAKAEFDALEAKLQHNLSNEIDKYKREVMQVLSIEIVKRWFFEAGIIQETLKDDVDLNKALEILADQEQYNRIFSGK